MSLSGSSVSLSLNVLVTLPNPTASFSDPAVAVQIANASPFIIEVVGNGEQFTIQAFTAQTIPLTPDGTPITVLPTNGPAGTQGVLTPTWLLKGQQPDMADGQLTGSAQYAVGLGTQLLAQSATLLASNVGIVLPVPLNPLTRTVILHFTWQMATAGFELPNVAFNGGQSNHNYYNAFPYLFEEVIAPPNTELIGTIVVPIVAIIDTSLSISLRGLTANNVTFVATVWGDTALYDESVFYNGVPKQASTSVSATTLVTGPCRLLTVSSNNGAAGVTTAITVGGTFLTSGEGNPWAIPQPYIIPSGVAVVSNIAGGAGRVSISTAYP